MIKRTFLTIVLASSVLFACSAKGGGEAKGPASQEGADGDTSYALGVVLGSDLKQMGIPFNYDELIQGFHDAAEGKETRFSTEEAFKKVQEAYSAVSAKKSEADKAKEAEFLTENAKKEGIKTTASGLQYQVVSEGKGAKPGPTDTVKVNYEGKLMDGTVFDSSYERGESAEFALDQVIPGWSEGIQLMSVGSTYNFFIPSALGYGDRNAGPIPPNSPLIFKVELLDTKAPAK